MKLTSSRMRPDAATPALTGHSGRIVASESATARRQNACMRRRTASGSVITIDRIVSPENTVSSTSARDAASATPASRTSRGSGAVLTIRYAPPSTSSRVTSTRRTTGNQPVRA